MHILVDQNISYRLVQQVLGIFPEITHVRQLGLSNANDFDIFMFARRKGFDLIFTQDEDFHNILLEHGPPPKIVWLRVGNCSTKHLAEVVQHNAIAIVDFAGSISSDCLEIFDLGA